MRKFLIILCLIFLAGCGEQQSQKDLLATMVDGVWWVIKTTAKGSAIAQDNPYISGPVTTSGSNIEIDAYGYGVHSNRFAQQQPQITGHTLTPSPAGAFLNSFLRSYTAGQGR